MLRLKLLLAFAGCSFLPLPARAAPTVPVVLTAAYHYLPGDVRMSVDLTISTGQTLRLVNVDPVGGFHTLTAEDVDAQGRPIFDTGDVPVAPGSVADVVGTEKLISGRTYGFYCTVHGASAMEGRLTVVS